MAPKGSNAPTGTARSPLPGVRSSTEHPSMIRVLIKHRGLLSAVCATFGGSSVLETPNDAECGDLVITTTQDTPPEGCLALSARGIHVVVLASHPKDSERARYELSGVARYIDMTADAEALVNAVTMETTSTAHKCG